MARRKFDRYETMPKLTHYLLKSVPEISGSVVEPCAGNGNISRVLSHPYLRTRIRYVDTNDIDPMMDCDYSMDAGNPEFWLRLDADGKKPDWVVTNAPFSQMHRILPLAVESATFGVAFLGRLTYLEPTMKRNVRGGWLKQWAKHMSHLITFGNPRPSFTGTSMDSVTTAWMVWQRRISPFGSGCQMVFANDWQDIKLLPANMDAGCPSCGSVAGIPRICNQCLGRGCSALFCIDQTKEFFGGRNGTTKTVFFHDECDWSGHR